MTEQTGQTGQEKSYGRIVIAGQKSGSGKTLLTCGILQLFQNRGIPCASFKCGPDYIDPMFHREVLQISGSNLDTFFVSDKEARRIVARETEKLSVIEGVMGYYDGIGGTELQASTYDVALATDSPVILVVDGKNSSLSIVASIYGFLHYQPNSRIQGVICNRMKKEMYQRLVSKIEQLGVKPLGYVPEYPELHLESRHLGLIMPTEVDELQKRLYNFANQLEETLDVEGILRLAETAPQLSEAESEKEVKSELENNENNADNKNNEDNENKPKIAVARDEAFCFYYPENLRCLEDAGAELAYFSPLHDEQLPEGTAGLLLGGGYPELYARELSEQRQIREEIYRRYQDNMPILAECGGFLYLHQTLEDAEGTAWEMVGAFPQTAWNAKKLGRFGYVTIHAQIEGLLSQGDTIKGHEFHYWESSDSGSDMCAKKPIGTRSWECMIHTPVLLAGFPHLYYLSNPKLAERFVYACKNYIRCKS